MKTFNEIINNEHHRKYIQRVTGFNIDTKDEVLFLADFTSAATIKGIDIEELKSQIEKDYQTSASRRGEDDVHFADPEQIEALNDIVRQSAGFQEWANNGVEMTFMNYANDRTAMDAKAFYVEANENKYFLSLDLKKAGWQNISKIIGVTDSFQEWAKQVIDLDLLVNSKYLYARIDGGEHKSLLEYNREVIVRSLNEIIAEFKLHNVDLKMENIAAIYADEVIFEITKAEKEIIAQKGEELQVVLKNLVDLDFHVEAFKLIKMNHKKAYARITYDNEGFEVDFKFLNKVEALVAAKVKAGQEHLISELEIKRLKTDVNAFVEAVKEVLGE